LYFKKDCIRTVFLLTSVFMELVHTALSECQHGDVS